MKNKKVILITLIITAILVLGGVITFLCLNNNNKEEKKNYETYTMYVKINPLVKLTYRVEITKCKDDKGQDSICYGTDREVTEYELVNNDAKEIYNELDFTGKDLHEVLVTLCDTARDNNIGFEKLEITTDDKNIEMKKIAEALKENSKYETTIDVFVDFEEHINVEEILDGEEISEYLVKFDTDGANKIDNQLIKINEKVVKPTDPTKEGYIFKEWQLNGNKYDFNTAVNQDMILVAKWEKEKKQEEVKPKETVEPTSKPTATPKPTSTPKSTATPTQKPKETSSKTGDFSFEIVVQKNLAENYKATIQNTGTFKITFTGDKELVNNTTIRVDTVYMDLSGLKPGTHTVKLKANVDKELTYEIKPSEVTVKIEEFGIKSTVNRINLNDNLLVRLWRGAGTYCGYYIFADNVESVVPAKYISSYNGIKRIDIDYEDNYRIPEDQLNFNATAESNAMAAAKAISLPVGISEFTIYNKDHHIGYSYNTLRFDEDYGSLNKNYDNQQNQYYNKLDNVFKNAYYVSGQCGDYGEEALLTQAICNEFNLTCDRW